MSYKKIQQINLLLLSLVLMNSVHIVYSSDLKMRRPFEPGRKATPEQLRERQAHGAFKKIKTALTEIIIDRIKNESTDDVNDNERHNNFCTTILSLKQQYETELFAIYQGTPPKTQDDLFVACMNDNLPIGDSSGTKCLHLAAKHDAVKTAKFLIDLGADVNQINVKQKTPLFCGAKSDMCRMLVANGADPNAQDIHTMSLLSTQVLTNNTYGVRLLCELGADPYIKNKEGETAESLAREYHTSENDTSEITAILRDAARDFEYSFTTFLRKEITDSINDERDKKENGKQLTDIDSLWQQYKESESFQKCKNAHPTNVKKFFTRFINNYVYNEGRHGNRFMHIASINNAPKVAQFLIDNGANVNINNHHKETPLHCAKSQEMMAMLIGNFAQLNIQDNEGYTPLFNAVKNNNSPCVKMLLAAGADFKLPTKHDDTILSTAMHKNIEIIEALLNAGADAKGLNYSNPNSSIDICSSPLLKAILLQRNEIIPSLVDRGADIHEKNDDGDNALLFAIKHENNEILPLLLQLGANIHETNTDGNNALHLAIQHNNNQVIPLLLSAGADIEGVNQDEDTPLLTALAWNRYASLALLIGKGACVNKDRRSIKTRKSINSYLQEKLSTTNIKRFDEIVHDRDNKTSSSNEVEQQILKLFPPVSNNPYKRKAV